MQLIDFNSRPGGLGRLASRKSMRHLVVRTLRHTLAMCTIALLLIPLTATQAAAPFLEKLDLFVAFQNDYKLSRIPGIVVTKCGTVLAYGEARKSDAGDWGQIDVFLRRSIDGNIYRTGCLTVARLNVEWVRAAGEEADICVYGGTSGGVVSAVQAARMGKRVVLVEPGRHLGGMTSGGLSAVDIGDPRSVGGHGGMPGHRRQCPRAAVAL